MRSHVYKMENTVQILVLLFKSWSSIVFWLVGCLVGFIFGFVGF